MRTLLLVFTALAALLFSGCNTFENRAEKKASVFASLDVATQERLRAGDVRLGDTTDMAYLALGSPDERRERVSAEGATVIWIYTRTWHEYRGDAYGGSRLVSVKNPTTGAVTNYYEPVRRPVYETREQEQRRLIFKDDKIIAIEQAK